LTAATAAATTATATAATTATAAATDNNDNDDTRTQLASGLLRDRPLAEAAVPPSHHHTATTSAAPACLPPDLYYMLHALRHRAANITQNVKRQNKAETRTFCSKIRYNRRK
jgi:hypothetical protein